MSGPNKCRKFNITIGSGPQAVRQILSAVLHQITIFNLNSTDTETLELVLAEVLNNVVEHAYRDGTAGEISVSGKRNGDKIHLCVKDFGRAMPKDKIPCSKAPNPNVQLEELPEGGFGWFLIHTLTEAPEYRRVGNQNRLSLCLPVKGN